MIYHNDKFPVGIVVGTYGSVPYIHLHLESRKRFAPDAKMLVHDDCSPRCPELCELTRTYGSDFSTETVWKGQHQGDLRAICAGLKWARDNGIEVLVKFSRRFIPTKRWIDELRATALRTQAPTFSNEIRMFGFGFRTDCFAMHVPSWIRADAISRLEREAERKAVFVEGFCHGLARETAKVVPQFRKYEIAERRPDGHDSYGRWALSGVTGNTDCPGTLQHFANPPQRYAEIAAEWKLPYATGDFVKVDQAST